jgi:hypothetical protein
MDESIAMVLAGHLFGRANGLPLGWLEGALKMFKKVRSVGQY